MRWIGGCLILAAIFAVVVQGWGWTVSYYDQNLHTLLGAQALTTTHPSFTMSDSWSAGILELPWGVAPKWGEFLRQLPFSILTGLVVMAPFLVFVRYGLRRVVRFRALAIILTATVFGLAYGAIADYDEASNGFRHAPWKAAFAVAMLLCGAVAATYDARCDPWHTTRGRS